MCYPCTHCNKCGRMPQPGLCASCGYVNGLDARVCQVCGAVFPAPPGKADASIVQQDASGSLQRREKVPEEQM